MIRHSPPPAPAGFNPAASPDWKVYKWHFRQAQHGKCGYCECLCSGDYGAVEHYAPQNEVAELDQPGQEVGPSDTRVQGRTVQGRRKPGYGWLAHRWENWLSPAPSAIHPGRAPSSRSLKTRGHLLSKAKPTPPSCFTPMTSRWTPRSTSPSMGSEASCRGEAACGGGGPLRPSAWIDPASRRPGPRGRATRTDGVRGCSTVRGMAGPMRFARPRRTCGRRGARSGPLPELCARASARSWGQPWP